MEKQDVRSMIRALVDDPDGQRWPNATLDLLTNLTYNRLWAQILRVSPRFLHKVETVAAASLTSPGYVDLDITGSGGALSENIFRINKVLRNDKLYHEASEGEVSLNEATGEVVAAPDYTWLAREEKLYLFPLSTSEAVQVNYSYYPAAYTSLAEDSLVPWVENHYDALIWSVSAQALLKGAAEDNQLLYYQARDAIEAMLGSVQTLAAGPLVMTHYDDGTHAWGSTT